MKRNLEVTTRGHSTAVPAGIASAARKRLAGALALLLLLAGSPGCGSSVPDSTAGAATKGGPRYRIEGTGKDKQEVLVRRRDERHKKQQEAAQKGEPEAAK